MQLHLLTRLLLCWSLCHCPFQRYLDIIMRGARHFGVDPAYISRLEQVPVQARKKVSEYRSVPTPPERVISAEELFVGFSSRAPPAAKVMGPFGLGCWEVIGWLEGHKKGADQPSDQNQADQP